jgi:hypothetical protein
MVGVPASVLGATIHVPLQAPTIQAGVDAAASGDTVLVAPGIYRGYENKRISFYGRDIKLLSEGGPASTIIDVEGFGEPDQAFRIEDGETASALIDGFTVQNGYLETGAGAGMFIGGSSPTVRNCIFVDNWMGSAFNDVKGGAVAVENGSPSFTNCSFTNNRVQYFGEPPGFGSSGGAIYCRDSSLQFTSCTFQSNAAAGVGYSGAGGAIACGSSSLDLINCAFYGNVAELGGGGLVCGSSTVTIDNTIFAFNETDGTAGGIKSGGSILEVTNCTFFGNAADQEGGALFLMTSNVLIEKTIIAFGASGGAVRCISQGPDITLRCTDIFGNIGGDWTESCIAAQAGSDGNISLDPLFCNAIGGDFHLHSSSPCAPGNAPQGCGVIGALDVGCGMSAIQEEPASPAVNTLRILHNPAIGSAEFEFIHPSDQILEIYDVGGRLIDRLQLGGEQSRVVWKPSALTPPGVYFAALRGSGAAVKFILLPH